MVKDWLMHCKQPAINSYIYTTTEQQSSRKWASTPAMSRERECVCVGLTCN